MTILWICARYKSLLLLIIIIISLTPRRVDHDDIVDICTLQIFIIINNHYY